MAIQAWHIMKEKISVTPDTTARDVSLKMMSSALPGIPVVSADMEVLGLVTEQAILGAIRQGLDLEKITAASIMVKPPIMADINTTPEELIQMLLVNNCCAVIAILNHDKYAGVVSRHLLMDVFTSPYYSRFAQKERKGPFVCL